MLMYSCSVLLINVLGLATCTRPSSTGTTALRVLVLVHVVLQPAVQIVATMSRHSDSSFQRQGRPGGCHRPPLAGLIARLDDRTRAGRGALTLTVCGQEPWHSGLESWTGDVQGLSRLMVGMPTNQKTLLVTDARLAGELGGGVWLTCGYGAGTLSLRSPPRGGLQWGESRQRR